MKNFRDIVRCVLGLILFLSFIIFVSGCAANAERMGTLEAQVKAFGDDMGAGRDIINDVDSKVGQIYSYGVVIGIVLIGASQIVKNWAMRYEPVDAFNSWTKGRKHINRKDWAAHAYRMGKNNDDSS